MPRKSSTPSSKISEPVRTGVTRRLVRLAGVCAVLYALLLAGMFFGQRGLLYPASSRVATAVEAGLADFTDVTLETSDGERLVGYWKPPEPSRALIVYFHGNGGSLWNRRERAAALGRDGRGVLLVSYRGYSGSTGSPTEEGLHRDARAAYDFALRHADAARIVLYGESLGTGVAVRLASEQPVGGVVLDAPYTSTADVARLTYWWIPIDLLMRDQFRSIDVIENVKAPLLVMHGTRDGIIPFDQGRRLYEAASAPKRFLRLDDVGHARVLEGGGLTAVQAFLTTIEERARP